jgi:S1-C subfamily serine protease
VERRRRQPDGHRRSHRSLRPFSAALLLLSSLGATGCSITEGSPPRPEASVVRLEIAPCAGDQRLTATGVLVSTRTVATVAHTFDDAAGFAVFDRTGDEHRATLTWLDPERDLALVTIDADAGSAPPSLPLGASADGDAVEVITWTSREGAGATEVRDATVLQQVTATLDGRGERAAIEIQAEINRGDSGAPVVNDAGQVIAMVFASTRDTRRGWAIAASEIETALAQQQGDAIPLRCG